MQHSSGQFQPNVCNLRAGQGQWDTGDGLFDFGEFPSAELWSKHIYYLFFSERNSRLEIDTGQAMEPIYR